MVSFIVKTRAARKIDFCIVLFHILVYVIFSYYAEEAQWHIYAAAS